jgi:hypothetical protein
MEIIEASPKTYARLTLLKEILGITGTEEDSLLSERIKQASAKIDSMTNREFNKQHVKENFRNADLPFLVLNVTPIKEIISILADGSSIVDDVTIDYQAGIVLFPFSRIGQDVEIEYIGGYETLDTDFEIPPDVENAALKLAMADYNDPDRNISKQTLEGNSISYDYSGILGDVQETLRHWRRVV